MRPSTLSNTPRARTRAWSAYAFLFTTAEGDAKNGAEGSRNGSTEAIRKVAVKKRAGSL